MSSTDDLKTGAFFSPANERGRRASLSVSILSFLKRALCVFSSSGHPALREVLEQRGVLDQLKARIRAEVFGALDEQVRIEKN